MAKDFLLEIGLEEMPAHLVTPSVNQLKEKTEKFLAASLIDYQEIQTYSTPRRLALMISGLAEKQKDVQEEVKGPAKKIALDQEGNWSKAAQGFVRGQGVTTAEIFFKEIKGVDYVYVDKFIPGKPVAEVLVGLKEVITSLTFPVSMHWNVYDFKFIRPIHWLVALLEDQIIPFEILTIQTGRISKGHRFLGQDVILDDTAQYTAKLAQEFVVVDAHRRKKMIREQIENIAKKNHWKVELDEDLVEEVNNLVEFPTAFVGKFAEKYLSVPEEVLVTSMKEHQRYFDVRNQEGVLLPYFISIRNGNEEHLENVIKGNQKVLVARLEDAEFFYQEDQKMTIAECVTRLKQVTFHEKIGSIYEKMQRVQVIAQILGERVKLSAAEKVNLQRAAEIYKFDLVTNMVGEFPELQGVMGEKYALLQGEKVEVAQAIREHYLPVSSEGQLPGSKVGSVLSIADKLDSLFSFFSVGMIPSGSNDPYALRRQTYGIIRIVQKRNWTFPIQELQQEIVETIAQDMDKCKIKFTQGKQELIEFIKGRVKQLLVSIGVRHDVIEAVLQSEQDDLANIFKIALLLKAHTEDVDFKSSTEALTRVFNLANKLDKEKEAEVNPELFENSAERELYEKVRASEAEFSADGLAEKYAVLKNLAPAIEKYFAETMVMAEDPAVRENRLRQLSKIAQLARSFARLDLLLVK